MKKIIAIALALVMCLGVMSMVAFAAPDGLSRLAMVGAGIPGVSEWNITDAAGDMTEVSNSVYEKTLTLTAGTEMKFKVSTDNGNGGWNDAFNFGSATLTLGTVAEMENSGGSGDMTFKADKDMTIKVTVDLNPLANGGKATILITEASAGGSTTQPTQPTQPTTAKPTTTQPTTAAPTTAKPVTSGNRTLTVKAPASWTKVYAYTWEPADMGDFPGSVMQKSGDAYKATIKNSMVNLVLSGEKADTTRQQTADIKLETNGKNVTIVVKDDGTFTVSYEGVASNSGNGGNRKPAAADPQGTPSNYRVVGNAAWMGSWKEDNALGVMIEVEPGVYRKNFDNVEPGSYELKITKDGKWDNAYGVNGQNFKFTVDQKCKITVDFTLKDGEGVISVYGSGVPSFGDVSMISVVILMALASVTAIVLVVNKKKFI